MKRFATVAWVVFMIGAVPLFGVAVAQQASSPTIIIIDPASPQGMLVSIGGKYYTATLTPVGAPAPEKAAELPSSRSGTLEMAAYNHIRSIPAYHRRVAEAIDTDMSITTENDVGKRAIVERDASGLPLGREVAAAMKASGGFDASGNVVDRARVSAVFRRIADGMEAAIGTK